MPEAKKILTPPAWKEHAQTVDAEIQLIDERILLLQGQIYRLELRRQQLRDHLGFCVRPLIESCSPKPLAAEDEVSWEGDRGSLEVFEKQEVKE